MQDIVKMWRYQVEEGVTGRPGKTGDSVLNMLTAAVNFNGLSLSRFRTSRSLLILAVGSNWSEKRSSSSRCANAAGSEIRGAKASVSGSLRR